MESGNEKRIVPWLEALRGDHSVIMDAETVLGMGDSINKKGSEITDAAIKIRRTILTKRIVANYAQHVINTVQQTNQNILPGEPLDDEEAAKSNPMESPSTTEESNPYNLAAQGRTVITQCQNGDTRNRKPIEEFIKDVRTSESLPSEPTSADFISTAVSAVRNAYLGALKYEDGVIPPQS